MIENNQTETQDTGESGETYDQEIEASRVLEAGLRTASRRLIE